MKIIYITANLPHGTGEAFVVPEVNQLVLSGQEVLVIPCSPRGRIVHGQELLQGARREALYSPNVLKAATLATLAAARQTAAAVRPVFGSRSPAVMIKNLAVVPKALWLADVAVRWGADHIHCHWAGTTATMAMLASKISGVPWSLTAHRWDIVENNLLATKVRSASFVRFISEDGLRMARSIGIGTAENARVLHMGVAVPARVQRRYGPRPIVLCPARLAEVKGHRFLLEAWSILQRRGVDGELWVAGDGSLRRELEALSGTLGLGGSTKFLGSVEHGALLKFYEEGAVSAVVLASVDLGDGHHEGIPVGLIEAMSYAIPVVATAAGGTAELVIPGTGVLVPPADPAALAEAIRSLLQDGELNEQLGRSGREHVAREYNIVRVAGKLVSEFESATRQVKSFQLFPALAGGAIQPRT
ncbi:MAG TPA: glycosyltransferase [Bryobacteraceae bacterium]|nr:glycosyltransferase [Bryobacteraceae bacterium]